MADAEDQQVDGPTLSIHLPSFLPEDPGDWSPLLELVRNAEAAGVDRIWVSDHVVFGERLQAYADPSQGGIAEGKQPTGPDGHWLEPITLLAVLAGLTSRVRLSTGILLAALRRPVVLAKELATLDVLSGGRVDLGVGVGWQREEYESAGLDFHRRGSLLDHTLAVCQRLWRDEVVDFDDQWLHFERIHTMPKPRQTGGIPVWISGRINDHTVARLVRYGNGWIPWGEHIADPEPGIRTMRDALDAAGRDPTQLQVQGLMPVVMTRGRCDPAATMERVPRLLAAGVTDFRIGYSWTGDLQVDGDLVAGLVDAFSMFTRESRASRAAQHRGTSG